MKRTIEIMFLAVIVSSTACGQTGLPAEIQIKSAILAAPAEMRDGAKVLGYDGSGKLVTLREGSNDIICLADDPNKEGFSAAAYQKDLEPFMARGRELRVQGKTTKEVFDIREKEVKEGKLQIPQGSILYVLSGDLNESTGEVANSYVRYVVYIPYATVASTGLSDKAGTGIPWIMDPGTHRAHIMLNPPQN